MAYTQENRLISIDTPLGTDVLLLQRFAGQEGLSRLFHFQLDLLSERTIDLDQIVGQRVTINVRLADGGTRHFNGHISRFAAIGGEARFTHYRAEMVPWLWFLTRSADCRIFQNLTIPNIISTVFEALGFSDFKNLVQGLSAPREYCVQYRETDFNFVSRLMEQYGIFYFFEHGQNKHTLVMANAPDAHPPCPRQGRARFEAVAQTLEAEDTVTGWLVEQEYRPGRYTLRDYNFETPNTDLEASVDSTVNLRGHSKYELFDYPGEYLKKPEGEQLVKIRIQEEEVPHLVITGASTCRAFTSGYRFDLVERSPRHDGTYVLTEVQHAASVAETYATGAQRRGAESYANQFTCIPHTMPFRPPRVTARPTVPGVQTAVVAGKTGEEIWTDKYGRVKVQFHWDRQGKYDEHSSCWIRVAQSWAGKRWGTLFLPRVGQEVAVDFLEGDPDQPIIIGSVYNAEQMPPYALPGEQTKSTVKSYSSKGGGGFNEIRLEDKKGKEQLFINADRNQDVRVKNDSLEWIGQDRHLIVTRDQLELVKGDTHLHVKCDQNEKVDGTLSFETGMDLQEKVGMNHALDAGMEIHFKSGLNLVVEAGVSLTFKVGGNFININPGGIFIQAALLMMNSGGAPGNGAGAMPQPPTDPQEADTAEPGAAAALPSVAPPPRLGPPSPQAVALRHAAQAGLPFCERCAAAARAAALAAGATPEEAEEAAEAAGRAGAGAAAESPAEDAGEYWRPATAATGASRTASALEAEDTGPEGPGEGAAPAEETTFIEIELVDDQGQPLAGKRYRIVLPDGATREGTLDAQGRTRIDGLDPGTCQISFPDLDGSESQGSGD